MSAGTGVFGRRPYGRNSGACVDVHRAAVRERERERNIAHVAACKTLSTWEQRERDTGSEHHSVVLVTSPKPRRGRVPKTRKRRHSKTAGRVVVNYPTVKHESIHREPTISQWRSTTYWGRRCQTRRPKSSKLPTEWRWRKQGKNRRQNDPTHVAFGERPVRDRKTHQERTMVVALSLAQDKRRDGRVFLVRRGSEAHQDG